MVTYVTIRVKWKNKGYRKRLIALFLYLWYNIKRLLINKQNNMKKRYLILGLSAVLLLFGMNVSAAEFVFPEKGGSIVINQEMENVYTAGNVVSINANVNKSLHAAGNTVNISKDASIYGTLYAGAGNVFIEGAIADDLFAGAGDVFISETASIGGDLVAGVGNITIDGPVGGDILLGAGEATINNRVAGNVKIKTGKLTLGDNAKIDGSLEYTSEKEAEIDKSKVLGEVVFHQQERVIKEGPLKNSKLFLTILTIGFFLKLLAAIAAGLIFVYLLKNFTEEVVNSAFKKFWPNLGIGFGALILTPVACIILAISMIGLLIAGVIISLYALLLVLASAFAGIILGSWLIKLITKKKEYVIDWKAVVLGVVVIKVLAFVPFVGWLAKFIFLLMALGALVHWVYKRMK